MLGQFLRYELGLEAGWFLRNGVIILRIYAAVAVGFLIVQLAGAIVAIPQMGKRPLSLASFHLYWIVLGVVKVSLLWEAASMLKMMMNGTRENTRPNV